MNAVVIKNFFVFEGIDGSGTTTQIKLLQKALQARKKSVFSTYEPTNAETGKFLRRCLSGEIKVQDETMLMLFAADRNEHIFSKNGILNMSKKNNYVICDRYLFSSLAYQGASGFFDLAQKFNANFPLPKILFFLDIDVDTAFQRIEKRDNKKEIYENKKFQNKVRNMYLQVLDTYKNTDIKIITIDAKQSIEKIHSEILNVIDYYKN